MEPIPAQATPLLIRYGFTGIAALATVLLVCLVGAIPLAATSLLSVSTLAALSGFLIDAVSAYKLHPSYRRVRRQFFFKLALCGQGAAPVDDSATVRTGIDVRERVLWNLPPERRVEMRVEHGLWIATFHLHMIAGAGAFAFLTLAGIFAFDASETQSPVLPILAGLTYALFSALALVSALARLRDYNEKLFHLARETAPAFLRSPHVPVVERLALAVDQPSLIWRAFKVAFEAHLDEVRDNGEPYIAHPVRTAVILCAELNIQDAHTLALALLHDVLEHRPSTRLEVANFSQEFGPALTADCQLLATKVGKTRAERDRNYAAVLRGAPWRVRLVKMADRIDNVRSLVTNPSREKVARYVEETERDYILFSKSTSERATTLLLRALEHVKQAA